MPLAGPSNRPVRERSWRKLNFPTEDFVRHGALARAADPAEAGQVGLERFGLPIGGAEGTHVGDVSLGAGSAKRPHEPPMRPEPGSLRILDSDVDAETAAQVNELDDELEELLPGCVALWPTCNVPRRDGKVGARQRDPDGP